MAINTDRLDREVRLRLMPGPAFLESPVVVVMQLADVTSELESAYGLH